MRYARVFVFFLAFGFLGCATPHVLPLEGRWELDPTMSDAATLYRSSFVTISKFDGKRIAINADTVGVDGSSFKEIVDVPIDGQFHAGGGVVERIAYSIEGSVLAVRVVVTGGSTAVERCEVSEDTQSLRCRGAVTTTTGRKTDYRTVFRRIADSPSAR